LFCCLGNRLSCFYATFKGFFSLDCYRNSNRPTSQLKFVTRARDQELHTVHTSQLITPSITFSYLCKKLTVNFRNYTVNNMYMKTMATTKHWIVWPNGLFRIQDIGRRGRDHRRGDKRSQVLPQEQIAARICRLIGMGYVWDP
jgi:hypothetical protein